MRIYTSIKGVKLSFIVRIRVISVMINKRRRRGNPNEICGRRHSVHESTQNI